MFRFITVTPAPACVSKMGSEVHSWSVGYSCLRSPFLATHHGISQRSASEQKKTRRPNRPRHHVRHPERDGVYCDEPK